MAAKKLTFDMYYWIHLILLVSVWVSRHWLAVHKSWAVEGGGGTEHRWHPTGHDVKQVGSINCGLLVILGNFESLQRGRSPPGLLPE